MAVPWVTRPVSRRPLTAAVELKFQMDKVAPRQPPPPLRVFRFSPVSIIPQMLHAHLRLEVFVTRRKNGRSLGAFQKAKYKKPLKVIMSQYPFHVNQTLVLYTPSVAESDRLCVNNCSSVTRHYAFYTIEVSRR
jgi:hypothetical protein